MLTYFSYSLCVENFYLAWDKYATILLKFTLRELLLNQLKLLNFVYLNVLSGVLKELFLNENLYYYGIIIVRGGPSSWLSWETLAHEFTPSRAYMQAFI